MLADRRRPKRKPGVMQHAGMLVVPATAPTSQSLLDDNRDFVAEACPVEFVELPDDER